MANAHDMLAFLGRSALATILRQHMPRAINLHAFIKYVQTIVKRQYAINEDPRRLQWSPKQMQTQTEKKKQRYAGNGINNGWKITIGSPKLLNRTHKFEEEQKKNRKIGSRLIA